ncbi:hypothetical protein, partial [Legionella sp. 29fVS95]|uniref:hypothetical protein n=1 Tax=Legionella sp. 29fVS95 TaxID=3402813 RepID=UPI003AF853D8
MTIVRIGEINSRCNTTLSLRIYFGTKASPCVIHVAGVDLETLAREYVFGPRALNMPNSSYGPKPVAANSLRTTAEE